VDRDGGYESVCGVLDQGKYDEAYVESNVNAFKEAEFSTQSLLHIETLLRLT
jgi:hypothetical protein